MPKFRDINFKYTDAEEEKTFAPELINDAYVDINQILKNIHAPEKFLVVGSKGSGKTALSSKLMLLGETEWDLFVDGDIIEQFEYQLLNKTGGEKGVSIGGALTTWQLILFLRLVPLFLKDEQFKEKNQQIVKFNNSLKKHGLTESDSLLHIIQYTSRRGVFAKLKSAMAEVGADQSEEDSAKVKDPAALLSSLKHVFGTIEPTESRYYFFIDGLVSCHASIVISTERRDLAFKRFIKISPVGRNDRLVQFIVDVTLDYILRKGKNNCPYIADLINAVRELNLFFVSKCIQSKIIILIRDEVLNLVPDPNLTKRLNDNGVQLRWYDNVRSPFETSLLEVLKKRAELAGFSGSAKDLWYRWFPKIIHHSNSLEFVIVNTRYLPRDFISFFREMQALGKEPPFNKIDVLSALNNYSDWFLKELSDALVGLVDEGLRTELPNMITELGREFSLKNLKDKIAEYNLHSASNTTEQVARELFNTSWLGNKWATEQGTPRYAWRHRKQNAKLNLKHTLVVHSGLWKSLNLI